MLQKTMEFIMQVLNAPNADPRQKDGALHMVCYLKIWKEFHLLIAIFLIEFHAINVILMAGWHNGWYFTEEELL